MVWEVLSNGVEESTIVHCHDSPTSLRHVIKYNFFSLLFCAKPRVHQSIIRDECWLYHLPSLPISMLRLHQYETGNPMPYTYTECFCLSFFIDEKIYASTSHGLLAARSNCQHAAPSRQYLPWDDTSTRTHHESQNVITIQTPLFCSTYRLSANVRLPLWLLQSWSAIVAMRLLIAFLFRKTCHVCQWF